MVEAGKRKRAKDYEERIEHAIEVLTKIINDVQAPRNIRRLVGEAINSLKRKEVSPGIRVANAISKLDEASQDITLPSYMRVAIWNAISIIEVIKD